MTINSINILKSNLILLTFRINLSDNELEFQIPSRFLFNAAFSHIMNRTLAIPKRVPVLYVFTWVRTLNDDIEYLFKCRRKVCWSPVSKPCTVSHGGTTSPCNADTDSVRKTRLSFCFPAIDSANLESLHVCRRADTRTLYTNLFRMDAPTAFTWKMHRRRKSF